MSKEGKFKDKLFAAGLDYSTRFIEKSLSKKDLIRLHGEFSLALGTRKSNWEENMAKVGLPLTCSGAKSAVLSSLRKLLAKTHDSIFRDLIESHIRRVKKYGATLTS